MLVFQSNFEHIKDGCKRARVDVNWLIEMVYLINKYLPENWRLTRTANNFRIQIVSDRYPSVNPHLIGSSFFAKGDSVLHIIDTIGLRDFIDVPDSANLNVKWLRRDKFHKYPELFHPNLYFFEPSPPNSPTPLFARQYEKIRIRANGVPDKVQYHRIHPLSREGVDPNHHLWVRWHVNGLVTVVPCSPPEFHGKDFWLVPQLKDGGRARADTYIRRYNGILRSAGIKTSNAPLPEKTPAYGREYKFHVPSTSDQLTRDIITIAQKAGFACSHVRKSEQDDTYFDDTQLRLHKSGLSLRLRKSPHSFQISLKKRRNDGVKTTRTYYERIEEHATLTPEMAEALENGQPIGAWPHRVVDYLVPERDRLEPVLRVKTRRQTLTIKNKLSQYADVSLDRVVYSFQDQASAPYTELEIESHGLRHDSLKGFISALETRLGLVPSMLTKYERGVSLMRTRQLQADKKQPPKRIIIDTDCGVDDALALILALRAPNIEVLAITCVAGNVALEKVIPNVRKVLAAVRPKTMPVLAAGASKPLLVDLAAAESVHGSDGLGDCTHISDPGVPEVSEYPAWKVICDLADAHPGEVTVITLGPLTNLATAMELRPASARKLNSVIAMGGVFFETGNVGPDAEFNVATDPLAAKIVTEFCRNSCRRIAVDEKGRRIDVNPSSPDEAFARIAGYRDPGPQDPPAVSLTFVGLDVTHKVVLRRAVVNRLAKTHPRNNLLQFVREITRKYMDFYNQNEGLPGCYLHDPLAVAYAINPAFLDVEKHIVRVESRGQFTNGVIFPDDRPTRNPRWRDPADEVIGVARRVEKEAFEEFVLNTLAAG